MKDYGTNNCAAWNEGECDKSPDGRHKFSQGKMLGNCYELLKCEYCGAQVKIDSSD